MARARNIKPGFFKNEDLAECSAFARLCFAGLWTMADRKGRLEDRPKRIKGELFAYDSVDVEPLLAELAKYGFIARYVVQDQRVIQVLAFARHQNPHHKERPSELPPMPGYQEPALAEEKPEALDACHQEETPDKPKAKPRQVSDSTPIAKGVNRAESGSLIPDPLNLIPDSLPLVDHPADDTAQATAVSKSDKQKGREPAPTSATWQAYSTAYAARYGAEPVRNAKVNGQLAQVVARLGADEAPAVAAFFLTHTNLLYDRAMHPVDLLLRDCEKLRTEWATGRNASDSAPDDRRSRQLQTAALMTGTKPVARRMGMARDFTDVDYREGIDANGHPL